MHTPGHIDVSGLPAPIAHSLAFVAQMALDLNSSNTAKKPTGDEPFPLAILDSDVIGTLSREEIYDDR